MSFKSLEQRFNENVKTLYAGATLKFEDGKPSNGRSDDPIITREPGKGYWGKMESRATPVRSAAQDVKRLTLFQLSPQGIQFLAKQQLLQSGNTFKFTRIINPAFVVANAVPFLHVKRNLRPLGELKGKTDTSDKNVKKMGTMQEDSYKRLAKYKPPIFIDRHLAATKAGLSQKDIDLANKLLSGIKNPFKTLAKIAAKKAFNKVKSTIGNQLAQKFSPITNTLSALNPTLKRNVGDDSKYGWNKSRPELAKGSVVEQVTTSNTNYQEKTVNDTQEVQRFNTTPSTDQYRDRDNPTIETAQEKVISFIKYFDSADSLKNVVPGQSATAKRTDDYLQTGQLPRKSKISYIKDPSNTKNTKPGTQAKVLIPYKPIPAKFDDAIKISFAIGKDAPIQFRAYIKDLIENSNPQYQSFQYIGRTEKFVNYTGVQREISFKLSVLAFSKDELNIVWRRINYITGMVFPYGFTRGILQPNIVRLTMGNIYVEQPGYISSLSTNFNEPSPSWDLDEQVTIGATMDIKFILIEKASKIADSPFYGITETMDPKSTQKFNTTIKPPKPRSSQDPKKDAATNGPSNIKTDERTAETAREVANSIAGILNRNRNN